MNQLNILNSSKKFNLILQDESTSLIPLNEGGTLINYTDFTKPAIRSMISLRGSLVIVMPFEYTYEDKVFLASVCRNVTVVFPYTDYTISECQAVISMSEACAIGIRVPCNNVKEAYKVLINLHNLFPCVDDVYLSVSGTTETKYKMFRELRDALAGWRMQIFLRHTKDERATLEKYKQADMSIKVGLRDKKREQKL